MSFVDLPWRPLLGGWLSHGRSIALATKISKLGRQAKVPRITRSVKMGGRIRDAWNKTPKQDFWKRQSKPHPSTLRRYFWEGGGGSGRRDLALAKKGLGSKSDSKKTHRLSVGPWLGVDKPMRYSSLTFTLLNLLFFRSH